MASGKTKTVPKKSFFRPRAVGLQIKKDDFEHFWAFLSNCWAIFWVFIDFNGCVGCVNISGKIKNHRKSQKYALKYHTNTCRHVWSGFETFRGQLKKKSPIEEFLTVPYWGLSHTGDIHFVYMMKKQDYDFFFAPVSRFRDMGPRKWPAFRQK